MPKSRPRPLTVFAGFYLTLGVLLSGLILYGTLALGNRNAVWMSGLVFSLLLILGEVGILFFQNWGRHLHFLIGGLVTVILIPAVLKFVMQIYACKDNCDQVNSTPGEVTVLLFVLLLGVMYIGSLVYFNRLHVKELFRPEME